MNLLLIIGLGDGQLKLLFPGGLYDTKYLAGFFPNLLPYTSLEELHSYLAPKASDSEIAVSAEGDVEHQSNAPSTDDSCNNMKLENEAAKGDVHNEEGLASETHQEGNVHVILADLSRRKCIHIFEHTLTWDVVQPPKSKVDSPYLATFLRCASKNGYQEDVFKEIGLFLKDDNHSRLNST